MAEGIDCELCGEDISFCLCQRCLSCEELQPPTPMVGNKCCLCGDYARDCLCDETCRSCGAPMDEEDEA